MIKRIFISLAALALLGVANAEVFYNQVWRQTADADYVGRTNDVGVADLNGDGRDDVWLVDPNGPSRVWLQNASGVLEDSGQAIGAAGTNAVVLGDLDGDGDIDAVEAVSGSDNKVWLNNGSGVFSDAGQSTGDSSFSFGLAMGDLDGDGDLDLFVANTGAPNTVWSNDGSGVFTDTGQTLGGNALSSGVALGDLDGDGRLDAVVANAGANSVWINDGHGVFSAGTTPATGNASTTKTVVLADFDGDSKLDAFFGEVNGNHVWKGDGAGGFSDTGLVLGTASSQDLVVQDMNGDGKPDVYVANDFTNGADKAWLNTSTSSAISFTVAGLNFGVSYSSSAALGDFDNDGRKDDIFVGAGATRTQPDHIWLNQNDIGNFVAGQTLVTAVLSNAVALGDLDGDGDFDAFVANSGANAVLLNNSGMQFQLVQSLANEDSQGVALDDFDQDGDLDAVVANGSGGPNRIWLNDGAGHFTDSGIVLGSGGTSQSLDVVAANLDGDVCPDVVIANFGFPDQVWLNVFDNNRVDFIDRPIPCQFNAAPQTLSFGNNQSAAVVFADINSDGLLDVLFTGIRGASTPSGEIRAWTNDPLNHGHFLQGSFLSNPSGNVRKVVLGELTGDGNLDAFGVTSGSNLLWQGDGHGGFSSSTGVGIVSDGWDAAIGDIDTAGGDDIFVVSDSGTNKVLYNDGTGNFTDSNIALPAVKGRAVGFADLDGDQDLDAFIAANGLNVALRHDPFAGGAQGFDVDGNGAVDALTDGIIIIRYMFGIRGAALIQSAIAPDATADGPEIETHMVGLNPTLDADGNGAVDALTDGIIIIRYIFGFRGSALIQGALAPNATNTTSALVEAWAAGVGL